MAVNRAKGGFMDACKGFEDWLECLKCPHLCTNSCPIENEDVMEEMNRKTRLSSPAGAAEKRNYSDKLE
jgi:hypothetical protein